MARVDIYTPLLNKEERYSDIAMGFEKSPITGNISRVSDVQSIKQALKTMILTNPRERLYNNRYGSTVKSSLFDPIDPFTTDNIRSSITTTISNFEPRVTVLRLDVIPYEEQNLYKINLIYSIINIPEAQQLDLTLRRVR
jgi:phage baseplate assembly protein W